MNAMHMSMMCAACYVAHDYSRTQAPLSFMCRRSRFDLCGLLFVYVVYRTCVKL